MDSIYKADYEPPSSVINTDACYHSAEKRAENYYESLYQQLVHKEYIEALIKDFQLWQPRHILQPSILSHFNQESSKPNPKDYHRYIQWLDYSGRLDNYLTRSVSYIYMRDLGKNLCDAETQTQIHKAVSSLKTHFKKSAAASPSERNETISMTKLYRSAQKEGIESTFFWIMDKLQKLSANIPEGIDAEHAKRKLIKIIGGVLMHELDQLEPEALPAVRTQKIEEAIRLGYCYGLTYPFIDDLLDSKVLSSDEKKQYSKLISTALTTGTVPELGDWTEKNKKLMQYVHSELRDAFEYIKAHQSPQTHKLFFEQAYIFFNAQEADRSKSLSYSEYTNEEIYIPIILKSSFSRLIARSVINVSEDTGFDNRTFFYGIYNQLADDFTDMFDDFEARAVTPYTYYMQYHEQRHDLINPYELYWTVIFNLIHHVYDSDPHTSEVILSRAVNGLKRFKERVTPKKYNEVMGLFASGNPALNRIIQKLVQKADDIDFFDKLLRDHMITALRSEKQEQETFIEMMKKMSGQMHDFITIKKSEDEPLLSQLLVDTANYSLKAGGKQLRPLMAWAMGVNGYQLNPKALEPLLKSLEYMHTASMIFDDLPSQDNADTRRGRPTLHTLHNPATAELTGLFLIQKAFEAQSSLDQFEPATVLKLIQYSSYVTAEMCKGQEMDLNMKGKQLTGEQLNTICFYKTGIAFEASLVMPAILAQANDSQIERIKHFARHAGIAFQIKDDLLDAEGDAVLLGKSTNKDTQNNNSTFVTILGTDNARKEMWNHYCEAIETLKEISCNTAFLKQLLHYIINRDH